MSEYIEIEVEFSDDDDVLFVATNLKLSAEASETYDSLEAMEEGSPIAQAMSVIQGIVHLGIEGSEMVVRRDPKAPWHVIVADISAVLKDFFL
jgi:hypothetical protein